MEFIDSNCNGYTWSSHCLHYLRTSCDLWHAARRHGLLLVLTSLAFLTLGCRHERSPDANAAERTAEKSNTKPVIRIAYPGVGIGGRPYIAGNVAATVHGKRALETEFERDGITIDWSLNKGAGPAVNELLSSHQLDLAYLGDLPALIGRSIGLDTKIIAAGGRGGNLYLAVRKNAPFRQLNDLRGKRVSVFKGTALQLQAARILQQWGYSEADFKTITMDQATGLAAILNGDIDALWAQYPIFEYVERGDLRIITSSQQKLPDGSEATTAFGVLLVTTEFVQRHADWVQRVVNAFVKEADWCSSESNRVALYRIWSRAGYPEVVFYDDGNDHARRSSPLIDAGFVAEVTSGAEAAFKLGLMRKAIDVASWFEPKFLQQALKDLNLQQRWVVQPAKRP